MNLSGIESPRAGAGPERLAAALTYRYAIDRARGAGPGGSVRLDARQHRDHADRRRRISDAISLTTARSFSLASTSIVIRRPSQPRGTSAGSM